MAGDECSLSLNPNPLKRDRDTRRQLRACWKRQAEVAETSLDAAGHRRLLPLTAISRLSDVADGLERAKAWPEPCIIAGYVFGSLLDPAGDLECVQLALVVDEPADDVPWMSRPRHLEALASLLRFDKLPISWCWRPSAWPVWNHEIARAVCFWSAATGSNQAVFDALSAGHIDKLEIVGPATGEQLIAELIRERDVGRGHLADAVAGFYDRDWRSAHTGNGVYPADHLWWATSGFLDLDSALTDAGP